MIHPRYSYRSQPTTTARTKANARHTVPQSSQDIPDDLDARLVVLRTEQAYSKEAGNKAEAAAKGLLETRGNAPRIHRNTLVFLAADNTRLQDLEEAVRRFLAWDSIINEKEKLNLDPQQVKQAETQLKSADGTVTARLPETYQWLLVREQKTPQDAVKWEAYRLTGQDPLAVRASKRLHGRAVIRWGETWDGSSQLLPKLVAPHVEASNGRQLSAPQPIRMSNWQRDHWNAGRTRPTKAPVQLGDRPGRPAARPTIIRCRIAAGLERLRAVLSRSTHPTAPARAAVPSRAAAVSRP